VASAGCADLDRANRAKESTANPAAFCRPTEASKAAVYVGRFTSTPAVGRNAQYSSEGATGKMRQSRRRCGNKPRTLRPNPQSVALNGAKMNIPAAPPVWRWFGKLGVWLRVSARLPAWLERLTMRAGLRSPPAAFPWVPRERQGEGGELIHNARVTCLTVHRTVARCDRDAILLKSPRSAPRLRAALRRRGGHMRITPLWRRGLTQGLAGE
jgi:hypothetical protein